jgi:hypothetical protein
MFRSWIFTWLTFMPRGISRVRPTPLIEELSRTLILPDGEFVRRFVEELLLSYAAINIFMRRMGGGGQARR